MVFALHSPILIPYLKESYTVVLESKNFDFFYSSWKYLILFFVFKLNIFTSKILNLLLPLGAEGAGAFESYPTSEIPNKYIYDTFLMIYLSILLLLFCTFSHFKEVNQRFTRAFCSFVRLYEKSHNDISKRATVKKEPLTYEKDKEDQSKYYLSYPKLRVLEMKWANRDINVAEWPNISKFSALDDLVTPFRLLELFFVIIS